MWFLFFFFLVILKQKAMGGKKKKDITQQATCWMDYSVPSPEAGSQNLWLIGQGNGKSVQCLIYYSGLLNFSSYPSRPEPMKHTDGFWPPQSVWLRRYPETVEVTCETTETRKQATGQGPALGLGWSCSSITQQSEKSDVCFRTRETLRKRKV